VCDQETSKTRRLKPATALWKIQPQWVVTAGKQTNRHPVYTVCAINLFFKKNINWVYRTEGQAQLLPVSNRGACLGACWDCGLESHRGHGCLSVVSVVCCQEEVSATDWLLVQRSPTDCGASLCVIQKPRKRRGWSPLPRCENTATLGCNGRETNKQTNKQIMVADFIRSYEVIQHQSCDLLRKTALPLPCRHIKPFSFIIQYSVWRQVQSLLQNDSST